MTKVLLIIAMDWTEARRMAREHGLCAADGSLKEGVRVAVRPEALRGWSHGTPVLVGRMADWPEGDHYTRFCQCIEAQRQRGALRVADDKDLARFGEGMAA